jgi:ABC-type nitrate/sulfonate/bicarbonate transport system substrate-binding protein
MAARSFLTGAALLFLLACQPAAPAPAPSSAQAGGPAAAQPTAAPTPASLRPVAFGLTTVSGTVAPIWVALDQGIFERHGLAVETVAMSPAAVSQALTAGSLDLATSGGSAISAYVGGATDLVFIAGLINKAHFKVLSRPEITRMEELRGKTIGSSTAGSGASMALFETLRRFGLEPNRDVQISYLREQPSIASGLLSGAVDAGVLAPPFTDQVEAQGARVLVDMRQFNVELAGTNLTTTRSFLARERDVARRFVMAYAEALRFAREQREPTVAAIMRGTQNPDREQAESAYEVFRDLWDLWPTEGAIQTVLNNLDEPGADRVRPAELLDLSILHELERSGWLAQHYGAN